jgi:hypothetical protein
MSQGTYVEPSKLTLGQYLNDMWLPSLKNGKLRATTVVSYEVHVVHHLTPNLGATPLQNLNRQRIAAHYAWLAENGRVPRRKPKEEKPRRRKSKKAKAEVVLPPVNTALSPTTVRRVRTGSTPRFTGHCGTPSATTSSRGTRPTTSSFPKP